ncbi:MAG: C_GCAxxG_C_C family protein [Deltaproteobacteria bacterium]|nr:C_GCAxxG_C_C family protein [Deltaproteobacteria bacterium]
MANVQQLQEKVEELVHRDWDAPAIEARFRHLVEKGIPKKNLQREDIIRQKDEILDRVQRRGEEYCYLTRSCAKGSCLALLEEFGLGSMDNIRGLSSFPGIAMSGGICGPVSGGLTALGLYFSDKDPADYANPAHYVAARQFIRRFENVMGSLLCPDIQERLLGRSYDPFAGLEEMAAFNASGAREKCPAAPGVGARIAAEIIIESMERA